MTWEEISKELFEKRTAKRFRVQEHCLMSSYGIEAENWLVTNDNHSVVLNDKAEAHMVANMGNDVINKLNNLYKENQQLQSRINDYDVALKTLQDLTERKLKENERLKKRIDRIDIILDDLNGAEYISRDDAIKALNKIDKVVR